MAKRRLVEGSDPAWHRAGYAVSGSPANLSLSRTMRNSLSRRIALRRPKPAEAEALPRRALRAEIERLEADGDPEAAAALRAELERLLRRSQRIPYIDPVDVRYRRFEPVPRPVAQAVMFCLMDVSGSMTEDMKDLAKRFYVLLYLFLQRRYKHVELVFIRHTHEAAEVDEETFFHSRETGGTLVSTALEEMRRVVADRYPPADWNIYAAQASDGDNASGDSQRTARLLTEEILPACQYYAYIEVGRDGEHGMPGFPRGPTDLWRTYETLVAMGAPMAMKKVRHRREIFPVFRELFQRQRRRRRGRARMSTARRGPRAALHRRRMGFRHAPPHPRRLRGGRARRARARRSIRTGSRSSAPSRCSTPTPRSACRSSTGTGPSASTSRSTRRCTARGCAASPTRSSSTPTPASPT